MAVRSLQLGNVIANSVTQTAYTCPAGRTAILKEITLGKLDVGAVTARVWVLRGANPYLNAVEAFTVTQNQVRRLERWTVLEPGDQLQAITDSGSVYVWLSGTELIGVA